MKIKIRPAVLVISLGLVIALNVLVVGIVLALKSIVSTELAVALIAFGGTLATLLAGISSKLVESEEKTENGVKQ